MRRQRQDVLCAFTQRGQGDHVECQAVQQIGPEFSLLSKRRQIFVGSADDAHIGQDRVVSADPFKFSIFNDAEYFFLHTV